ncbi:amino acid adenylation domain-containing protein, partial [Tenacibaculum halocynthiae]|uniref:amino acid adenylation domain-containing protein n=1 Tax=Tenacibaculum halocynthiae TaxID=1254437 RepID=UPI0038B454AD
KTIIDLFKEQVSLKEDTAAVVFEQESLSYKELDSKSTIWAKKLVDLGVEEGSSVGLMMTRSIDIITAILAVLKVGAHYTPIAIEQPILRTTHMLKESGSKFAITNMLNKPSSFTGETWLNIKDMEGDESYESKVELPTQLENSLAYCIFTSGSTGKPKGVQMEQRSVVNLVKGLEERVYKPYANQTLNVALLASYVFDASIQQIFGSLLQGHSLYITDDESRKDGAKLISFYNKNKIDVSDGTPTHLRLLVNSLLSVSKLDSLSSWILAGEVLSKDLVKSFYLRLGEKTQLYNFYGPTETCVDSTSFKVDLKDLDNYTTIPIGKPLPNERVYVTDKYGKVLPVGIVGELCIGGDGLAQGYLGDALLTSEKFSRSWIASEERVYRTGDLARWLPDGNLEYRGRKDDQVKIRGFRIELAEIEEELNSHSIIENSIVISKELNNEKQLVAYYQSKEPLSTTEIREYLGRCLPEYMIPTYYVHMEEFAFNSSGKINRKALPVYKMEQEKGYVAPSNVIEEKLVGIYSEILGVDSDIIGVNSKFFDLGG